MSDASAEDQLRAIERLLDDRVGHEGMEGRSVEERVADVIAAFDSWCDLAIRRLHEIHRLRGEECEVCAKYLDGTIT